MICLWLTVWRTPFVTRQPYSRALGREPSGRKLSTQFRLLVCERLGRKPDYLVRVYERVPRILVHSVEPLPRGVRVVFFHILSTLTGSSSSVHFAPLAHQLSHGQESSA